MNIKRLILAITMVLSAMFILGGCSKEHDNSTEEKLEWKTQKFQVQLQSINSTDKTPAITSLSAYVFANGTLQKIFNALSPEQAGIYNLYALNGSTVYFLANLPETAELKALKEGVTTQTAFLALRSQTITAQDTPPLFFSGSHEITTIPESGSTTLNVPLRRNQAQIDLDTSRDEKIKVTRIVMNGASSSTTLFSGELPSSTTNKIVYDKPYEPAITSRENIFQIFESNTPLNISVYANYQDIPTVVNLTLPQVKRNFKYTIKLEGVGTTIIGSLQIVPWEDGGIVEGTPDQSKKISLDKNLSTLPQGTSIEEATNTVTISDQGGSMTLAFTTDIQVELGSAEGLGSNVTIAPQATESKDGKVISKFKVDVLPQGKGRLGYLVTLHMKRSTQQFSYNEFYLYVKESSHQIMDTTIGGVTWMSFNATTPNLDDQIYLLDGETVEDAYKNRWGEVIGGLFQWGRQYMYIPWKSGSTNAGGQLQDNPWINATHVPCPEGYRIPTKEEMRALLPPNQEIPSTYTYNGETITAKILSATPEAINLSGVTGKARYLSLTSDTGASLFIPLAGQKGDKSGTNNPNFGQGFSIWTNERKGATSGWAWTGYFWPGINNDKGTLPADSQLQAEAYAYLRCVKK